MVQIQIYKIVLEKSYRILFVSENNYQEEKCQYAIEAMRECCKKWKKESLCCDGIDITERKAK